MARKEQNPEGQMTFVDHLGELRRRIIISAIAVACTTVVVFALYNPIIAFLSGPYRDATVSKEFPNGQDLIVTAVQEGFLVRIKVATYGGIALALPILTWQVWAFISPGLHRNERKYAVPFVLGTVALFFLGATVAWLTFPRALDFLFSVSGEDVQPLISAANYLQLVSLMFLAFGAAFEFPVVLVALLLARAVTTRTLRRGRRWALVGLVTFAAVITPSQDPYSLLLMAGPMYLFYEVSILVGRVMKR